MDNNFTFRPQLAEHAQAYAFEHSSVTSRVVVSPFDFTVCRNPLGCSPKVIEGIRNADFELSKYPPAKGALLKKKLAEHLKLTPDNIVVGSAAEQLLHNIAELFIDHKTNVVVSGMTYPAIPLAVRKFGGTLIKTPLNDKMQIDLLEMTNRVELHNASLVFLCNPNNPTGHLLTANEIMSFVKSVANAVVVVDEAAIEFCKQDESLVKHINAYPNLIVVKTFSKGYGLAALRVGYLLANPLIAQMLESRSINRPLNEIGEKMACLALDDHLFLQSVQNLIANERERIVSALNEMGLTVYPSSNNNLFIKVNKIEKVLSALAERGIAVKSGDAYDYQPASSCFRLSIQDAEKNSYFISQLQSIIAPLH